MHVHTNNLTVKVNLNNRQLHVFSITICTQCHTDLFLQEKGLVFAKEHVIRIRFQTSPGLQQIANLKSPIL